MDIEISPADQVSLLAISKTYFPDISININDAARGLGIPLMSENRNRKALLQKIAGSIPRAPEPAPPKDLTDLVKDLFQQLAEHSGAINHN